MARPLDKGAARALGPTHRQLHRGFDGLGRRRVGRAFVERHRDVGAEQALDRDRALRGQQMGAAVEMRAEGDAVLADLAQFGERHDLEPAGIGQDRVGPVHKKVQSAEGGDPLRPRPQHQMIGVAEDEPRAGCGHPLGGHRLDRRGGADRHKHRRLDHAMRGQKPPAPRGTLARQIPQTPGSPRRYPAFREGSAAHRDRPGPPVSAMAKAR